MNALPLLLAGAGALLWWLTRPAPQQPDYVTPEGPWYKKEMDMAKAIEELSTPRSIRNNNAGNLIFVPVIRWQGQTGADPDGFAQFATPWQGIRAATIDLLTGFRRDGEDTIRQIIAEWAPSHENPTDSYMHFVGRATGWGLDESIAPTRENLEALIYAIGHFEAGAPLETWYPPSTIRRGVEAGLAA